ncbi:hypothetical protein FORC066_3456 [Yersinia enterocolitica]|nr:hypothetical protein FORC065_1077 [Yersinia enterocolitica]UXD30663.1 hypothetical protein FORC066_3456 [Yersinia enterocolitica]
MLAKVGGCKTADVKEKQRLLRFYSREILIFIYYLGLFYVNNM